MNEPNSGLIGYPDLSRVPDYQQLRVGTTPTAFQAMKLGMGFTCEVDEYHISVTGPRKTGIKIVDPKEPEHGSLVLLRKNRQTLWFQKVHGLAHWQVYFCP